MEQPIPNPNTRALSGPPLALLPVGVLMVVMGGYGLTTVVPERWGNARRVWEIEMTQGRVIESRWVEELRTGRGGFKHRRKSPQSLIGYSANDVPYEVWIPIPDSRQNESTLTQPGSEVTVWYHPDRPGAPTLYPPRRWGDAIGVLLSGWVSLLFVGGGTAVVVFGLIRQFRPSPASKSESPETSVPSESNKS